jgi:hypothetical protein
MPENLNQVVVLIAFLIPGFVFTRLLGLSIPSRTREATSIVLDSLAMSCVNYAFLSPLVLLLTRGEYTRGHPIWAALGWFAVLFLSPGVLAVLAGIFVDSPKAKWLRRALRLTHPVPKAWDYFFRQGKICWIMATLKDGRLVAGLYGSKSFASSYPDEEDLYLERLCSLSSDGRITGFVTRSEGAILKMDEVSLLEFYSV